MPIFKVQAPDGSVMEIEAPEGASDQAILQFAAQTYKTPPPSVRDTGFTGAAKASIEQIQADAYKTAGKLGILPIKEAEAESAKHEARSKEIFQPTEKDFLEPTGQKFRELLGGSLPYIAAPVAAAGVGMLAVPSAPILAPAIAAGLAGTAQYTGSNLARQMEADKKGLEETNLGYAVAGAVPQALLDTYSLGMTPLIRRMFASAGIQLAEKEAVDIAKRGLMSTLKDYGGVTAKTATREGLTEAAQQSIERLQAGLNITDAEARKEYFDSFIGGAVLGGTLAPVGRYLEGPARPSDQGIRPLTDQTNPLTDQANTLTDQSIAPTGVAPETFKQSAVDAGLAQGQQLYQEKAPLTSTTPIGGAIDTSVPLGRELSSTQAEIEALGKQNATLLAPEAATVQPTVAPEESAALALKLSDGLKQNPALRTQFEAAKQEFDTQGRLDLSQVFQTVLDTVPPVLTTPVIAPEVQQKVQEVRKTLIPALKKYGLEGTGLQIMDSLGNGQADGYYAENLITVALDSDNHLGAMRHETVHALKNLNAFTPQEWRVLTNKAKSDWIPQFISPERQQLYRDQYAEGNNGDMTGFDEYLQEEGIAEAFKHFNNKLPAGMVGNLMYRLRQFFQSLKNTFSGQGFNTSDSIFRGIEATKYKPQAPAIAEGKFAKREPASKAPEGIPQSIWDLHEKVRRADAESMGEIAREKGLSRGAMKRNQTMAFKRLNKAVNDFVGEEKSLDLMVQMNQESGRREAQQESGRFSFVRKATKGEKEISTQNATGVKAKFDPLEDIYSIDEKAVLEAMEINPAIKARTIEAIKDYGFIPKDTADDQVIPLFKKNIVNNLLFLYNSVPAEIRNRSKLWYDGANKIAKQMGKEYSLTDMQVSGILAAMSPQKDWFQNVSMAERAIDILSKRGDMAWDANMLKYAQSYVKNTKDRKEQEKRGLAYKKIEKVAKAGTKLNDMDIESAAAFVRAYDEAFHSRSYRIVTPEGGFSGLVMNMPDKKGDIKESTLMWSTYDPIEKSVSIYRNGSRDNISQQLGFEHKIRSFYNNIVAPNSDISHVTIDTHAVAAGLFEALAGSDLAVAQNFGATGTADNIGVGGTYGLIADAYRDAAKQVGMKAREMQSITWEAVRGLFDENMKSSMKAPIRGQWTKYKNGDQTFEQAREKIIKIAGGMQDPQWVGSDAGQTIAEGASSYDKSFQPEGGVRLRKEEDIREKITVNLSNVTSSIPGLNELYNRSMSGDEKAYAVLQDTAKAHLEHLLSGTSAKVNIEPVMGAYGSEREPAINAALSFPEADRKEVMAAVARFATNFNQQQVHVRQATAYPFGHDFGDGSYATNVWKMGINRQLTNDELAEIIKETGIPAITVAGKEKDGKTQWTATTYFVDPFENTEKAYEEYIQQVKSLDKALARVVGRSDKAVKPSVERLYVYGDGYGARLGYESIAGDVRPKQASDTRSPKLVAEYFKGESVEGFKQKGLSKDEIAAQKSLAQVFEALPTNDLKRPIVRRAYTALANELKEQYKVLPIKVEVVTDVMMDGKSYNYFNKDGVKELRDDLTRGMTEAEADSAIKYLQDNYGQPDSAWKKKGGLLSRVEADNKDVYTSSSAVRRDVSENNKLRVYKTSPETFGPKGASFKSHPLLKDSGLKDANGYPMLYNDLLRAVHDYYAHNITATEFGPKGELAAARNHLAVTKDPMAKWALIAETRLQNAWQNFTKGVEAIPLKDRPFATQKAALPPIEYALSGDPLTDVPVRKLMEELTPEQSLGSLPPSAPIAKKYKFSLREPMSTLGYPASRIKAPDTPAFKQWFGNSKIVDAKGNPLVLYHGTARDITAFKPKQAGAIFLTADPTFAEDFGDASEAYMIKELFNGATPQERNKYIMDGANVARKNGDISAKEFAEIKSDFSKMDVTFGLIPSAIEQEVTYVLKNQLPTRQNILPLFASVKNPFNFADKQQVDALNAELNQPEYNRFLKEGDEKYGDKNRGFIERGHWSTIESEKVQKALKKLGHDGFFVLEGGRKNLAVYDPAQVKSATGNIGTYDINNPDIRFSLRDKNLQEFVKPSQEKGVWYHGSANDITEFKPKQANSIFLTQDPDFASTYTQYSQERNIRKLGEMIDGTSEKLPLITRLVDEAIADKRLLTNKNSDGFVDTTREQHIETFMGRPLSKSAQSIGIGNELTELLADRLDVGKNVMPVYVRVTNPFDYDNPKHISKVVKQASGELSKDDITWLKRGEWSTVESGPIQDAIRSMGFDGYYVREHGRKNLAVYNSNQIKSATGNIGAYDVANPDIRFALNVPPKQLTAQTPVYTAGQQVQQAASAAHQVFTTDPNEFWTKLRINWVDPNAGLTKRLQNLPIFDTKGQLRADMLNRARAQSINLIKNGLTGGVPVLNNDGSIIIKNDAVNNLANSQLLADGLNSNYYVRESGLDGRGYVAEVARALRGEEIMQEDAAHNAVNPPSKHLNREKQVDAAQIAWAKQQMQNVPELADIFSIWKNVNTSLVDLWEKVGLLDAKTASEYRGKKSYVSLAASIADMEERMGEGFGHAYTGTKGVKKIQRLEGSDLFRNIWENVSKQYASMVAGAYQNQTRKVAVDQLSGLGLARITNPTDPDINLRYKDQNNPQADKEGIVSVVVDNPNDVAAFESMHYQLSPIMKAMSGATGVLRAGALLNPMFWIRQLIRDPIQAALTNSPVVTPLHSAKEYINILRRDSAEARLLAERGVIGPVDSTLDLQDFLETAGQEFSKRGGTSAMLGKLMEMHEASDAATRVAIYKKALSEALARGLNTVDATNEAVYKARESINFAVRGNSPTLAALRHMTPFLSAAISSLDVLYKAATGYGLPPRERAEARAMFKRRALMMGAMSIAYAMMMQDDEEYQKVPDYIRDNNWLIHNPFGEGFIKIPTPFEVGFLMKTIPEAMVRYISGNSTGQQVIKSYLNGLGNSLPGDAVPLPQLIKPAVEAITNFSLFTYTPIESIGESKLPVEMRGRKASETAKALSQAGLGEIGLSPAKIDHLIQGYLAEWGSFSTFLFDKAVTESKGETPMDKNLAQQPFFKSFITDPTRDKVVGDFYELYRTANQVSAAVKEYKSIGEYSAIEDIYADEDKVKLLQAAPALNRIADNMGKINSQIRLIQKSQSIPSDERLKLVTELEGQLARVARQHLQLSKALGIQ